jgi:hypothetical protein
MATKTVLVSDLTGKDIPDGQHARIVFSDAPGVSGSVEIDVALSEVDKLESETLELVSLAIYTGTGAPRRVVMQASNFQNAFKSVDIEKVLKGARKVSTSGTKRASAPRGERIDYGSAEHAGTLHRGRITDAEKAFVKANKEVASKNRQKQTGSPIDWNDAKEKARYGF